MQCYATEKASGTMCSKCMTPIYSTDVKIQVPNEGAYHGKCFICNTCLKPLGSGKSILSKTFHYHEDVSPSFKLFVNHCDLLKISIENL